MGNANFNIGDKVCVIKGDYRGVQGKVIDRKAWEELVGEFDIPDWAVFIEAKSGSKLHFSPDELEWMD